MKASDALPRQASRQAREDRVDYSGKILGGPSKRSHDYTVFTYDDWQSGQARGPYPQPPNHIVSIRERRYKLARYYDAAGKAPGQWEVYDLKSDPLERRNLAHNGHKRSREHDRQYRRLRRKLAHVERVRLQPPKPG